MQVFISADMEGISAIVHPTETNPDRYDYERGRALMTAEVNAAIAGVLDAESDAEIRVADSHGTFRNLLPEDLDDRALLVRGKPRPWGMMHGLRPDTDALLLVGYHGRAGSGPAVLAHTMSDAILDIRVAGRSFGEIGLNAAAAGHVGAPIVLLSGDDAACTELHDLVPNATTVPVKQAVGQSAAVALHPAKARDQLRRAAAEAVTNRHEVRPFQIPAPIEVDVDLYGPYSVDLATLVPGVSRRAGARTVTFTASDFEQAYSLIQLLVQLASIKPN